MDSGVVWRCGCGHPALLAAPTCPSCGWRIGAGASPMPPDVAAVAVVDPGESVPLPRREVLPVAVVATGATSAAAGWYLGALLSGRLDLVVATLFVTGFVMIVLAVAR